MQFTGERVREVRRAMGLNQEELSLRLGFANGSWASNIERGLNGLDALDLAAISEISGYPMEYFVRPGFEPRTASAPRSMFDWLTLFPDEPERASAHADLDKAFRRARGEQE